MLRLLPLIAVEEVPPEASSEKPRHTRRGFSPLQPKEECVVPTNNVKSAANGDENQNPLGLAQRSEMEGSGSQHLHDASHHSLFGSASLDSQNAFQYDVASIQFLLKYAQRKKKVNAETQLRTVDIAQTAMRAGQETLTNRRRVSNGLLEVSVALSPSVSVALPQPPSVSVALPQPPSSPPKCGSMAQVSPFHRANPRHGVTSMSPRSRRVSSAQTIVPTAPRHSVARQPPGRRHSKDICSK